MSYLIHMMLKYAKIMIMIKIMTIILIIMKSQINYHVVGSCAVYYR
jgi:hypothetical protein